MAWINAYLVNVNLMKINIFASGVQRMKTKHLITDGKAMDKQLKTEPKRCKATKLNGEPCQAAAITPAGYCFTHEPKLSAERDRARQKGGKNSAKIVRIRGLIPPRLVEVYDTLEAALGEVHDGKLSPGQAGAMASIARAMVAVLESGQLEERVRDLEAKTGNNSRDVFSKN
jgi:hypothetical protein